MVKERIKRDLHPVVLMEMKRKLQNVNYFKNKSSALKQLKASIDKQIDGTETDQANFPKIMHNAFIEVQDATEMVNPTQAEEMEMDKCIDIRVVDDQDNPMPLKSLESLDVDAQCKRMPECCSKLETLNSESNNDGKLQPQKISKKLQAQYHN